MPRMTLSELDEWFSSEILPLESLLVGYLRRHWRNADEIGDLRQDIYVRVYEAATLESPGQPKAFLFTVARNLLIDRARRLQLVPFDPLSAADSFELRADELSPERHAIAREDIGLLQSALHNLPDRCREVVELRKISGLSQREVAEQLGISEGTVEKQISKGVRLLANALHGMGVSAEILNLRPRLAGKKGEAA